MSEFRYLENLPNYEVEEGEKYMNPRQLKHFREKLSTWKKMLLAEADETINHMRNDTENMADELDRASKEEEFRLELRTRERESKLIRKIEDAILRIDRGDYGFCKESGEKIGVGRLDARPTADLSIEAKTRMEKREKQGIQE